VQQLRGTRKGGAVFALLFEVWFGGWKGKGNLCSGLIVSYIHFTHPLCYFVLVFVMCFAVALMKNESKNQDLLK